MTRYQHPFPKATNYDASDPYGQYGVNDWRLAEGLGKHRGVDYNGADAYYGAPIPAIADGVIVDKNSGLGNRVVIEHPDGKFSGYAHMQSQSPHAIGTHVTRGQTIGYVGNTGGVPTHLHLTMAYTVSGANGTDPYWTNHFDPIAYIDARLNEPIPEPGEPMPDYTTTVRNTARTISTTDWTYLHLNDDADTSFIVGPAKANSIVGLTISGLAVGAVLQARFVKAASASDTDPASLGAVEIVGTSGSTYAQIAANIELGSGERLRVQCIAPASGVSVAAWNSRNLVW